MYQNLMQASDRIAKGCTVTDAPNIEDEKDASKDTRSIALPSMK